MMDKWWLDYGYWLMDTDWLMNMLLMDVNGCWWVMMVYEWMMVKWWKLWMLMVNEHGVEDGWWWVNDNWWRWWITVVNFELYFSCYVFSQFQNDVFHGLYLFSPCCVFCWFVLKVKIWFCSMEHSWTSSITFWPDNRLQLGNMHCQVIVEGIRIVLTLGPHPRIRWWEE